MVIMVSKVLEVLKRLLEFGRLGTAKCSFGLERVFGCWVFQENRVAVAVRKMNKDSNLLSSTRSL